MQMVSVKSLVVHADEHGTRGVVRWCLRLRTARWKSDHGAVARSRSWPDLRNWLASHSSDNRTDAGEHSSTAILTPVRASRPCGGTRSYAARESLVQAATRFASSVL
jgi:hypothetical protein